MEKQIVVCIGTDEAKNVRARLSLLLMEGGKVGFRHYHSISIVPGDDLALRRAENEANIADPNSGIPMAPWPKIPDDEWEKVEKCCTVVHTPDILLTATQEVQAARADILQQRAALKAEQKALEDQTRALGALKAKRDELKAQLEKEEAK